MHSYKKLHPDAKPPVCAHPGEDLGYDIFSIEDVELHPGEQKLVGTGLVISHGACGGYKYGFLVRDRSSMAMRGLWVGAGIIDAGYSGELKVLIRNFSNQIQLIKKGDKFAQIIPFPVLTKFYDGLIPDINEWKEVDELNETKRGEGGFGSTGK